MAFLIPHFLSLFLLLLVSISVLPLHAATRTITATHTYLMGDKDSKEDARTICLIAAKRDLLEQAGVLMESVSEVKNLDLTKDQITSYSAAILSVKILEEKFSFQDGAMRLTLTVSVDVDMDEMRKRLDDIVMNKKVQAKVEAQQQQIRQMEEKLQALSEKLAGATPAAKPQIEKNRDEELVSYYRLGAERVRTRKGSEARFE